MNPRLKNYPSHFSLTETGDNTQSLPFPSGARVAHVYWLQSLEQNDRVITGQAALHRLQIKLRRYSGLHNHHAFSQPTLQTYS